MQPWRAARFGSRCITSALTEFYQHSSLTMQDLAGPDSAVRGLDLVYREKRRALDRPIECTESIQGCRLGTRVSNSQG